MSAATLPERAIPALEPTAEFSNYAGGNWSPAAGDELPARDAPEMEEPMNLLLRGPPGSGKGTQARLLANQYGLEHIEVGEMLRAHAREPTVASPLAEGGLVPDDVVVGLVRKRLLRDGTRRGVVLDGFPRNLAQARALDRELEELELPLTVVFHFRISDELCIDRLVRRARREGRPDDAAEVAARRIELYHRETEPLVLYYERTGRRVVPIHADRSRDEVWREIREALELVPSHMTRGSTDTSGGREHHPSRSWARDRRRPSQPRRRRLRSRPREGVEVDHGP